MHACFFKKIFSRSESNILPLQGSDCCRSAGVEEAVEIFYPLVTFSPASTAGECVYIYLMHISEILFNLNSNASNFPPFLSYLCSTGTTSGCGLLLLWKTGHCSP